MGIAHRTALYLKCSNMPISEKRNCYRSCRRRMLGVRDRERDIENTLKIPFLIVDRPSGNFCMSYKSILNFLDKNLAGFACLMVARQQQV